MQLAKMVAGAPRCALLDGFAILYGFRCYDNIEPDAKCQRVLVLAVCLVCFVWTVENKIPTVTMVVYIAKSFWRSSRLLDAHKFCESTIAVSL